MLEKAKAEGSSGVEVWEENWLPLLCFLRCATQWVPSHGGLTGLNYQSLQWVFELYGVEDKRDAFEAVQVLESEALMLMNERGKKNGDDRTS